MPMKLSGLDSITDGVTGALQGNVDGGTHASVPALLHDGLPAQLISAAFDGSFAPVAAVAVLLAAAGLHVLRTRPTLALRFPSA